MDCQPAYARQARPMTASEPELGISLSSDLHNCLLETRVTVRIDRKNKRLI